MPSLINLQTKYKKLLKEFKRQEKKLKNDYFLPMQEAKAQFQKQCKHKRYTFRDHFQYDTIGTRNYTCSICECTWVTKLSWNRFEGLKEDLNA